MQTRNWNENKLQLERIKSRALQKENEKISQQEVKENENFFEKFNDFYAEVKDLPIPSIQFLKEQFHISTLLSNEEIFELQLNLSKQWTPIVRKNWTEEDRQILIWIVLKMSSRDSFNIKNIQSKVWEEVIQLISRRTVEQCKNKWNSVLKLSLQQIPWNKEQDQSLIDLINQNKADGNSNKWCSLAAQLNQIYKEAPRTGKQCRERWNNHLNPTINRHPWSIEEDIELLEIVKKHNKKWAFISKHLKTQRSENAVKNRFNCLLKKNHCNQLSVLINTLKQKHKQDNPQIMQNTQFAPIKKVKLSIKQQQQTQQITEVQQQEQNHNQVSTNFQVIQFDSTFEMKEFMPCFYNPTTKSLIYSNRQQVLSFLSNQMIKVENEGHQQDSSNQQQDLQNQVSGLLNLSDSQNYVKYVPCIWPIPSMGCNDLAEASNRKSQFNIPQTQTQPQSQTNVTTYFRPPLNNNKQSSFSFFSSQNPMNIETLTNFQQQNLES